MSNWQELEPNWLWQHDDFLADDEVQGLIDALNSVDSKTKDGAKEAHVISRTLYHYNVFNDNLRNDPQTVDMIFDKLNAHFVAQGEKPAPKTNLNGIQFYTKSFDPGKGYYELHVENAELFGNFVFMLYLTDETDGEIVLPSKEDAHQDWKPEFQQMVDTLPVHFVEKTISVLPKRNRVVCMRVGAPHYVKKCSGRRMCISGWPYASDEYRNKIKSDSSTRFFNNTWWSIFKYAVSQAKKKF
jgi:hypothetical protein